MKTISANIPDELYNIITRKIFPIQYKDINELVTKALKKFIAIETRKQLRERSRKLKIKKREILKEVESIRYGN